MCRKQICFCLALVLCVTSITYAGDYVISNWESTDNNDGWTTCEGWGNFGNTVLTPGETNGVTSGSRAIKVENDLGWAWGMKVYVDPAKFQDYDIFKLDITRLTDDWTLSGDANWNGIDFRVQGQGVSLYDLDNDESWWEPSFGNDSITASWDYSAIKSMFPAIPSWVEFVIAFNSSGYTDPNDRGTYYLDNARLARNPSGMTIAKCKIKAGKTQYAEQGPDVNDVNTMKDSFSISGTIGDFNDLNDIDQIIVSLISGDSVTIYTEDIEATDYLDIAKGTFKYSHKIPKGEEGAITSLKIAFNKNTFSIKAKNIDLTGLNCPITVEALIGSRTISGVADETKVNGSRKSISTRLMRLYDDTLIATKAKARSSTRPSSDSLSVKGDIAVEDMDLDANEPNLFTEEVTLTWGDVNATNVQTFIIPEGSFAVAKKGHIYKCKKVVMDINDCNEGLVTAKIDLDKCTFTAAIKNADGLYVGPGDAEFGISFASGFDETDEYTIP